MPHAQHHYRGGKKVVSLTEHRQRLAPHPQRLSPEHDGLELLYANDRHADTLFALKILAWARLSDGSVTAMVPWLNAMVCAEELADPLNGYCAGYRIPGDGVLFDEAPAHKLHELEEAVEFFGTAGQGGVLEEEVLQEIPDTIGTHVVFSDNDFLDIRLMEVTSWRLYTGGRIEAMVPDPDRVSTTPVLPGDPCLEPAREQPDFRYYFQHGIANKLKNSDPEALAALSLLAGRKDRQPPG